MMVNVGLSLIVYTVRKFLLVGDVEMEEEKGFIEVED